MPLCGITFSFQLILLTLFLSWSVGILIVQDAIQSQIESLVRKWAPLVFMAPGEKFYPSSVPEFLLHTTAIPYQNNFNTSFSYNSLEYLHDKSEYDDLPKGKNSESWYLVTKNNIGTLINNSASFLHGRNPQKYSVPVYAKITVCPQDRIRRSYKSHIYPKKTAKVFSISIGKFSNEEKRVKDDFNMLDNSLTEFGKKIRSYPHFHVTYWMFYPYNQGKTVCTVDMGLFGPWPIPKVNNYCLGNMQEFGNHVGDWEHMSLYFQGSDIPKTMYVSAHDVGAFYRYSLENSRFEFEKKEIRSGILQRATFPPVVRLSKPGHHPVLFAAKGSHGLWTSPGKHRFVRLPRLYDNSGFGFPWLTWKNIEFITSDSITERNWLKYRGRWGNPRSNCHPISRLGFHICEYTDGPTGIPLKTPNFQCS